MYHEGNIYPLVERRNSIDNVIRMGGVAILTPVAIRDEPEKRQDMQRVKHC